MKKNSNAQDDNLMKIFIYLHQKNVYHLSFLALRWLLAVQKRGKQPLSSI